MKRRGVIQGLLAAPVILQMPHASAQAPARKPLIFVLHGVTLQTPADRLFAIIDPVVSLGFPLAVAVAPASSQTSPPGLKELFVGLCRDYPGLVELCVDTDLEGADGWFQVARRSSESQSGFRRFLGASTVPASLQPRLTLLTNTEADFTGIRSSGFRIVLSRPATTQPARAGWLDNGIATLNGGVRVDAVVRPELLTNSIAAALTNDEVVILYMDMAAFAGLEPEKTFDAAAKLAAGLAAEGQLDRTRPILPSEFAVQYAASFTRMLAIRIDAVPVGHPQFAAQQELMSALRQAGIPLTIAAADLAPPSAAAAAHEYCLPAVAANSASPLAGQLAKAEAAYGKAGVIAPCLLAPTPTASMSRAAAEAGLAIITDVAPQASSPVGLDDDAMLHVPVLCRLDAEDRNSSAADVSARIVETCGNLSDAVVAVRPDFLAAPHAAASLREALTALASTASNLFVPIGALARHTIPADRALDLLRKVRHARILAAAEQQELDAAERGELLEDARLAWRYFSRFADKKTGFPPASAWADENDYSTYPYVTMWDCGSALLALVAAHVLKLIANEEFTRRATMMIAALHAGDELTGGMRLPKAYMTVNGSGKGDSGYDASDMGRLLVALKTIETYAGGKIECAKAVAGWDLAKTIVAGRIHSHKNGRLVDIHDSAYANYTVRGFAMWNFPVKPAFGIQVSNGNAGELLRVLDAFAIAEPVGAEPHVLEEAELGHSHVSRLVSDVLFEAQIERYKATGRFACVSEGPLDREPWFTYQGYRVLAEGDPWTIGTVTQNPRYKTEGFKLANEIVSTKSAFMWAGVRPGAYSRDLLNYVRARGKIPAMGFTSGIFAATGRAMQNYSDINTNAQILEAVAYMLNGNTPLNHFVQSRR